MRTRPPQPLWSGLAGSAAAVALVIGPGEYARPVLAGLLMGLLPGLALLAAGAFPFRPRLTGVAIVLSLCVTVLASTAFAYAGIREWEATVGALGAVCALAAVVGLLRGRAR